MFKGNWLLTGLLAFSLVFVTPPQEKKAEAFIFRAAVRLAVGAVRGIAVGVAAAVRGAAFIATRPFVWGARALAWGFRPWWGRWWGYRPWWNRYYAYSSSCWNGWCNYYPRYYFTTHGNWTNWDSTGYQRPVEQSGNREDWCNAKLPTTSCDTTFDPQTCWLNWKDTKYPASGNNSCYAQIYVRRKVCIAGGEIAAIEAMQATCSSEGDKVAARH